MLAGWAQNIFEIDGLQIAVAAYITKTFDLEDLLL